MENNKEQISEGLLTSIVDNFFKSLQRGVADRYIKAAEKAGVHPEVSKRMDKMKNDWEDLDKYMKKYHTK
jgi:hypothetical protein